MKKYFLLAAVLFRYLPAQAQWVSQPLPAPPGSYLIQALHNITAINEKAVWVSAGKYAFRTTDSGNSWQNVTPVINDPQFRISQINSIYAAGADTAYLLAENYWTHHFLNRVYKTTDGGKIWSWLPEAYPTQITYASSRACLLYFFDKFNGVTLASRESATGYFEIYTTGDGGNTWQKVTPRQFPAPDASLDYAEPGHNFAAFGSNIWIAVKGKRILKSSDQGRSWTISHTGFAGYETVSALAFKDSHNGLACSGNSLKKTFNGGQTWVDVPYTGSLHSEMLKVLSGSNGVYVSAGRKGSSYSTDNGLTWLPIDSLNANQDIAFVNNKIGYSVNDGFVSRYQGDALNTGTPPSFGLYPNPNAGTVYLTLENAQPAAIEVFNLAGRSIFYAQTNAATSLEVDLTRQPKGIYVVRITSSSQTKLRKLILQ
ncbi:T9SS type A sorting domain-containing protein [Adhaeribacter soli]|uniref:T9SS type A sorting domain-containing protein n=1 Tax=Adhaeribacter soli TaxID=2607655 RepID=A0A5N1J665_9BACT|nr:T9SS type A sorting domain-containing protein [Adhaeribacter soli]KAA9340083.1 T9SS type A sorting domain-containing protein [Adhaeribacter soli]